MSYYNIEPIGNLSKKELDSLVDETKDLLQGDMEVSLLDEFSQADLIELKNAFNIILNNPNLSANQAQNLLNESWRILYYQRPPSIEEFLSPEWLGASSATIRKHIHEWLCEWYNPSKAYRHCILSCAIGMGKSFFSVLNSLYVGTNIALMRNPWKTMSSILGESSPIAIIFVSYSIDKVTEILIEPFKQFLLTSPKFKKVKTLESMNRIASEEKGRIIPWTTAGETNILTIGNPIVTANVNMKVASDPARLLGLTLIQTIYTELSFFTDKGKSPNYIWRLYTDGKNRIKSRFPNQEELKAYDKNNNLITPHTTFFARSILDSSPNSWENPIDKYIYSGEADRDPENLIFRGSTWDIMPDSVPDIDNRFPVFIGTGSKQARILNENEVNNYDKKDVLMVPQYFYTEFYENISKALKDRGGIPSSPEYRLIENIEFIENMFIPTLKNIYSYILAPSIDMPDKLIWNQIKDEMFIHTGKGYEFYRNPHALRFISIDQSYIKDTTGISMCHLEQSENGEAIYVIDFTIAIEPHGGKINLEAITYFVKDLVTYGNINLGLCSYDNFHSQPAIQALERSGIPVKHLSVDTNMSAYLTFVNLLSQHRIKCGRNIYMKNNLRSLIKGKTRGGKAKIEHTIGEITDEHNTDWETSMLGLYAKDISDSASACVSLAQSYGTLQDSSWIWKEEYNTLELKEVIIQKAFQDLKSLGLRIKK